jgi:uncharacterized membrane protein YhhN
MMIPVLSMIVFVSAGLTILGRVENNKTCVYIFKPLTTLLILAVCLVSGGARTGGYMVLVASGLLFSLCGDIFLMLPRDRFVPGLASFLIAHLFYACAFLTRGTDGFLYWPLVPLIFYGLWIVRKLFPFLGPLKIPVSAYLLVIIAMAWQSWEAALRLRTGPAWSACLGALLFMLSDSVLAWVRFRRPLKGAEAVKLGLYYAAQWLIALSVKP